VQKKDCLLGFRFRGNDDIWFFVRTGHDSSAFVECRQRHGSTPRGGFGNVNALDAPYPAVPIPPSGLDLPAHAAGRMLGRGRTLQLP
jgi:hypothetical protein